MISLLYFVAEIQKSSSAVKVAYKIVHILSLMSLLNKLFFRGTKVYILYLDSEQHLFGHPNILLHCFTYIFKIPYEDIYKTKDSFLKPLRIKTKVRTFSTTAVEVSKNDRAKGCIFISIRAKTNQNKKQATRRIQLKNS